MRSTIVALSSTLVLFTLWACGDADQNSSNGDGNDAGASRDGTSLGDGATSGDGNVSNESGSSAGEAGGITCDTGPVAKGDRVVVIRNQCKQTVKVGVNGGYVEDCVNGACPSGTSCSDSRKPAGCFWDFPTPKCGTPVLQPGGEATYILSAAPRAVGPAGSQVTVKWSGNLFAETDCDNAGANCKTAQCAKSVDGKTIVGSCKSGTGPQGPTTLAEFTFVPVGPDFYDVSSINGVNVPVSMGAINGSVRAGDPYFCQTGGSTTASSTGLPACSWNFDPNITTKDGTTDRSNILRAVTPGGAKCTTDAQCGGAEKCGIAVTFGTTIATQSCGTSLGWWTGNELCVYTDNAFGAPLECTGAVAGQGKRADLFGCDGANPNSCYSNTTANATCCGCPDWTIGGQKLPVAGGFKCYSDNPTWHTIAEPWAAFVKKACPTSYSFPFDDPTSTYTCSNPLVPTAADPNSTNYEIVFCPGGKDGR